MLLPVKGRVSGPVECDVFLDSLPRNIHHFLLITIQRTNESWEQIWVNYSACITSCTCSPPSAASSESPDNFCRTKPTSQTACSNMRWAFCAPVFAAIINGGLAFGDIFLGMKVRARNTQAPFVFREKVVVKSLEFVYSLQQMLLNRNL